MAQCSSEPVAKKALRFYCILEWKWNSKNVKHSLWISYTEIVLRLSTSLIAVTLKRSVYCSIQYLGRNVSFPLVLSETFVKGLQKTWRSNNWQEWHKQDVGSVSAKLSVMISIAHCLQSTPLDVLVFGLLWWDLMLYCRDITELLAILRATSNKWPLNKWWKTQQWFSWVVSHDFLSLPTDLLTCSS